MPPPGPPRTRAAEPVEIAGGALPLAMPREHLFALLLAFTGLLLILGCELVFIRDHFGNRMNTVFKLYYQAWMLLALAGAYAVPFLVARARRPIRLAACWAVVLAAAVRADAALPARRDARQDGRLRPTAHARRSRLLGPLPARRAGGDPLAAGERRGHAVIVEATGGLVPAGVRPGLRA